MTPPISDGGRAAELEAELTARVVHMQTWGVWLLVEEEALRRGDDSVKIAVSRVHDAEFPVVFSTGQPYGAETEVRLQFIRVSSDWLLDELGPECVVLLDPHDLPGIRVPLGILTRPSELAVDQ